MATPTRAQVAQLQNVIEQLLCIKPGTGYTKHATATREHAMRVWLDTATEERHAYAAARLKGDGSTKTYEDTLSMYGVSLTYETARYGTGRHAEIEAAAQIEDARAAQGWHLFYIEASDDDGVHGFIVSAESASEAKAEELARASVLDHESVGTDAEPGAIDHCEYLGPTDRDTFVSVGTLASH